MGPALIDEYDGVLSMLQSGVVGDYENKWETEALRSAVKMRTMEV